MSEELKRENEKLRRLVRFLMKLLAKALEPELSRADAGADDPEQEA